ncbi:MAG TPA: GumC family protein [Devosia sp.]|nr:GumC family protein [Devosia sp.]
MTVESAPAEDLRMDAGALMLALWARALRIVLVTAFMVAVAYGIVMFIPKQYESVASLLVEDRTSSFTEAATAPTTGGGNGGITIDALMSSQIELIKSRDTLLAVADTLKLQSVPEFNGSAGNPIATLLSLIGRKSEPKSVDETVLQNLNERLTVIRERDSAVISIYVRSADPQLAARIANAIAAEHVRRRAEQSVTDTKDATAWLQQQIDQLRVKVQEADSKVADFKAQNSIFAGANGTTLPDQQISDIGKQITDAQAARGIAQQHAELIRQLLKAGESVEGVEDVRNSPVIQALMQNRATLQSTLAEKLATLLPAHPTIKALNAQIVQVNQQIKAEARRIADGLDAQVRAQDGVIATLNDDLKRAQLAASTQTKDGVTLDSLTREAKAQRDLLDAYLLKYRDASGRTDTGAVLPDVRIITEAAPSVVPASPKTALILGAVGIVSLVLQVGWVLFGELMSGRAVYDRNAVQIAHDQEPREPLVDDEGHAVDDHDRSLAEGEGDDRPSEAAAEEPIPSNLEQAVAVAIAQPEPPEDAPGPVERAPASPGARNRADAALALSNLSADLAIGRTRVLFLAGISEGRDAAVVADMLVSDIRRQGISICRIDAGSGLRSSEPGLTDLCAEEASFGDVVHKVRGGLAEVPWGQREQLDRRSTRPVTLVEALADIYEVVIVIVGRLGMSSSLSAFAGAPGRLVMVRRETTPAGLVEALGADAAALGFEVTDAVMLPEAQSEVA